MDYSVAQFVSVAKHAGWFHNDIVMDKADGHLKTQFFHSKSTKGSASSKMNFATQQAFHQAIYREYGVFGIKAFEEVIGDRARGRKSLRKGDVLKVVRLAQKAQAADTSKILPMVESGLFSVVKTHEAFSGLPATTKDRILTLAKTQATKALGDAHTVRSLNSDVTAGRANAFEAWLLKILNEAYANVLDEAN